MDRAHQSIFSKVNYILKQWQCKTIKYKDWKVLEFTVLVVCLPHIKPKLKSSYHISHPRLSFPWEINLETQISRRGAGLGWFLVRIQKRWGPPQYAWKGKREGSLCPTDLLAKLGDQKAWILRLRPSAMKLPFTDLFVCLFIVIYFIINRHKSPFYLYSCDFFIFNMAQNGDITVDESGRWETA